MGVSNIFRLGAVDDVDALTFNHAQMQINGINVQLSTSTPIAQN